MLPSIFIIPNEFLFLIEVIKDLCYYISYYFSKYFETFAIKLRLPHSAGLTIVNKDVLPFFFVIARYCLRESLNIQQRT